MLLNYRGKAIINIYFISTVSLWSFHYWLISHLEQRGVGKNSFEGWNIFLGLIYSRGLMPPWCDPSCHKQIDEHKSRKTNIWGGLWYSHLAPNVVPNISSIYLCSQVGQMWFSCPGYHPASSALFTLCSTVRGFSVWDVPVEPIS